MSRDPTGVVPAPRTSMSTSELSAPIMMFHHLVLCHVMANASVVPGVVEYTETSKASIMQDARSFSNVTNP